MTNKQKLRQCFYLHLEIKRLELQIKDLEEKSTAIRSTTDYSTPAVKHSFNDEGNFENIVIKAVDYSRLLSRKISELIDKQIEAEEIINSLDNDLAKVLLKYRYINGYEFKQIAKYMHYSVSHIYYLHDKFLNELV